MRYFSAFRASDGEAGKCAGACIAHFHTYHPARRPAHQAAPGKQRLQDRRIRSARGPNQAERIRVRSFASTG